MLLVVRITRRLTRSTLIGAAAGLFVAIDGMSIALSRTALLDNTLAFWVVVAFGCILMDRERTRRRLADRVRAFADDHDAIMSLRQGFGPEQRLAPVALGRGLRARHGVRHQVVGPLVRRRVRALHGRVGVRHPSARRHERG